MHILLDENVPRPIRRLLPGHLVETAEQRGWAGLKNGLLLHTAEQAGFDALVTADQNLTYQQNLSGRRIALVVLGSAQWPIVRQYLSNVVVAVEAPCQNSYSFVKMPVPPKRWRVASGGRSGDL